MEENLKKKIEREFLGKYVKLALRNNFVNEGTIEEISGDFLLFKTGVASSLININDIMTIVLKNRPEPRLFNKNDGGR